MCPTVTARLHTVIFFGCGFVPFSLKIMTYMHDLCKDKNGFISNKKQKCHDIKLQKCPNLLNIFKSISGSTEERTVLEKAEEYGCKREKSNPPLADVDLTLPTLEVAIGDNFELNLEFANHSDQRRTIDMYISGSVVYYTGVTSAEFLFIDPTVTIGPKKSEYGMGKFGFKEKTHKNRESVSAAKSGCILFRRQADGDGGGKELHEASGGTGQPQLYRDWENQRNRPDCLCHESRHPAQSQTQCQGLREC